MSREETVRMAQEDEQYRLSLQPSPELKTPTLTKLVSKNSRPKQTIPQRTSHKKQQSMTAGHPCKYCNSTNTVKYGKHKNMQHYFCHDCNRKFSESSKLPGMKTSEDIIRKTLELFDQGKTNSQIREIVKQEYDLRPSGSTIHSWISRFRHIPHNYQATQVKKAWDERPYRHVTNSLAALGTAFAQKPYFINIEWMDSHPEEWEELNSHICTLIKRWLREDPVLFTNTVLNREAIEDTGELSEFLEDEIWEAAIEAIWGQYDKLKPR